jgi:hypothetical protein
MCVDCVRVAVEPQPAHSQHKSYARITPNSNCGARSRHTSDARITPNSNCAQPPEDGQVTPEACTGTDP